MSIDINPLQLSYPNFVLGQIINPDEANQNNSDITNKLNEFIDDVNLSNITFENANAKSDNAVSTANSANTKSDNAITTANNANAKADSAIATANSVQAEYSTIKPQLEQDVIDVNIAMNDIAVINDAETIRIASEVTRVSNEATRVSNENTRLSSEATRVSNEATRVSSENVRISSENTRNTSESTRNTKENTRNTAETNRVNAETGRVTAENGRVTAENSRVSVESTRSANESNRVSVENARVSAENARSTNESNRNTSETGRVNTENSRVSAETNRVNAENIRIASETNRSVYELYSVIKPYAIGNKVSYNGSSYYAKEISTGITPGTDENKWLLIASKGETGDVSSSQFNDLSTQVEKINQAVGNIVESTKSVIPDVKVSTYSRVSSLSENAREGQMNVKVSGNTLKNEVVNGNFANGMSGYSSSASTITSNANVLSVTGTGSALSVQAIKPIAPWVLGKKLFMKVTIRVTNTLCTNIVVKTWASGMGTYNIQTLSSPIQNQWYTLYGTVTLSANGVGNYDVEIGHHYADATTALNKVMEVKDVICIDMGTDSSNPLFNKTVAEMDALTPNYFDGLASVVGGAVKTTGKNLFDGQLESGDYDTFTGVPLVHASRMRTVNTFSVKPTTNYRATSNSVIPYTVFYFDINKKMISSSDAILTGSFTTPSNCYFIRFRSIAVDLASKIQIEEGSVATPYEPYTETVRYLPNTKLRQLPNLVKDYVDGDRLVKNVQEYVLQASDITSLNIANVNNDYVVISCTSLVGLASIIDAFNGNIATNITRGFNNATTSDLATNIWTHRLVTNNTLMYIYVPKGQYANLAQAQTALAGTKILYQLATPIVTELLPNTLKSSPKGSVQYANIRGEVGFYTTGINVTDASVPIKNITKIFKVDKMTGEETPLTISSAVLSGDKTYFTHPSLVSGDLVDWDYEFDGALSTTPLIEFEYQNGADFPITNIVVNGDLKNGTNGWAPYYGTGIASNNVYIYTVSSLSNVARIVNTIPTSVIGNKYYVSCSVYPKYTNVNKFHCGGWTGNISSSFANQWNYLSVIQVATINHTDFAISHLTDTNYVIGDTIQFKNMLCINLTQTFGAGSEPTVTEMDELMAYFPNSWFDGTTDLANYKWLMTYLLKKIRGKADIAQETWITPTLLNGWTGTLQYRKNTLGQLETRCAITSGIVVYGTKICDMPLGYRPSNIVIIHALETGGSGNVYPFFIDSGGIKCGQGIVNTKTYNFNNVTTI